MHAFNKSTLPGKEDDWWMVQPSGSFKGGGGGGLEGDMGVFAEEEVEGSWVDSTLAVKEGFRLDETSIEEAVVLASNDAGMEASIAHTISSSAMPLICVPPIQILNSNWCWNSGLSQNNSEMHVRLLIFLMHHELTLHGAGITFTQIFPTKNIVWYKAWTGSGSKTKESVQINR